MKQSFFPTLAHGVLIPIEVPEVSYNRFDATNTSGKGFGPHYVTLGIDKIEGFASEELMIDGVSLVLALLQKFDPAIQMHCQVEGSPLWSVTTPDRSKGFPNTPTMMFCYYDVVRKWTLNITQKKSQ